MSVHQEALLPVYGVGIRGSTSVYSTAQYRPGWPIRAIEIENFSSDRVLVGFGDVPESTMAQTWDALVPPFRRRVIPVETDGCTVTAWGFQSRMTNARATFSADPESILIRLYDSPQPALDATLGPETVTTGTGSESGPLPVLQSGSWSVNQALGSNFSVIQQTGDVWSVGGAGGGPISISGTITATQGGTWSVSQATGSTFQVIQQTGSVFTVGGSGNFQIINSPGTTVAVTQQMLTQPLVSLNIGAGAGWVLAGTYSIPPGASGGVVFCGGNPYGFTVEGVQSGGLYWPNDAVGRTGAGAGAQAAAAIAVTFPFIPLFLNDTSVNIWVNFNPAGTGGTRSFRFVWIVNAPIVFPVNYGTLPITIVPAPNSQIAPGSTASSTGGAITALSTASFTLSSGLAKPANIYGLNGGVSFRNSLLGLGAGWIAAWCALVIQGATTGKALWVAVDKVQPIQLTAAVPVNTFFISFAIEEHFPFPVNCATFWPGDAALNILAITDLSSGVFTVFSDYVSMLDA